MVSLMDLTTVLFQNANCSAYVLKQITSPGLCRSGCRDVGRREELSDGYVRIKWVEAIYAASRKSGFWSTQELQWVMRGNRSQRIGTDTAGVPRDDVVLSFDPCANLISKGRHVLNTGSSRPSYKALT